MSRDGVTSFRSVDENHQRMRAGRCGLDEDRAQLLIVALEPAFGEPERDDRPIVLARTNNPALAAEGRVWRANGTAPPVDERVAKLAPCAGADGELLRAGLRSVQADGAIAAGRASLDRGRECQRKDPRHFNLPFRT
jgi:hypothetical protein